MKKTVFYIVACILICLLNGSAYAQEENAPLDPAEMLEVIDSKIFVRSAFIQDYSEAQGYVNELPNPNTIHQYFIYKGKGTDLLLSMLPAEESVRTTNKRLTFDQSRVEEFHITYKVQKTRDMPKGEGGKCWIRYSDVFLTGDGKETGLIVYPGDKAYYFTPVDGEMTYEAVADLSGVNPESENKFEFIRLDGIIYVYANGEFLFEYEDGIKDAVSFEAGSEILADGTLIRCDFDDFTVRIR